MHFTIILMHLPSSYEPAAAMPLYGTKYRHQTCRAWPPLQKTAEKQ